MDEGTLRFTSSLDVDGRMAFYDIMGSLAHVRMLKARKIIPEEDADAITEGLRKLAGMLEEGKLDLDYSLEDNIVLQRYFEPEFTKNGFLRRIPKMTENRHR